METFPPEFETDNRMERKQNMEKLKIGFICAPLLAATLWGADFDRGGVTFPMEQISRERFQAVSQEQGNLLKNPDLKEVPVAWHKMDTGWVAGRWIFGPENRARFNEKTARIGHTEFVDTESGRVMELKRPVELEDLMGQLSTQFSLSFSQVLVLPENGGGTFRISFESRNQVIGKNKFDQMLLVFFYDNSSRYPAQGKETGRYLCRKLNSDPEWQTYSYDFTVPPGTRKIKISFRGDGCGKLQIRNPRLARVMPEKPVVVELAPGELLDRTFALAANTPGIIGFRFKNFLPKGKLQAETIKMNLELPSGVSVIGTNRMFGSRIESCDIQKNGKAWKRWSFDVAPSIVSHLRNTQEFTGWYMPSVMLLGNAAENSRWDDCRFYLSADGSEISNTGTFTLRMMKPLEKTAAPKQFHTGFHSVNSDINFHQPEAQRMLSEFFGRTGNTLITSKLKPDYLKMLRENGIRLITAESYYFANGFRIGVMEKGKKPADSNYLDKDGKTVSLRRNLLWSCPVSIYNRTPYYTEIVLPQLKQSLEGLDGLQPNWEPYMSRNKGCFCDNCCGEFAKFAKLSPEKVKEIWPAQMQPGMPYHEQATRFRAWQHGRLIRTLHEDSLKLGAGKIGFCPEVGTDQIIRYPEYFKEQWEFNPYEYAGSLKWLNVWGPYAWFLADQPYAYRRELHLYVWEMAKRAVRDYRKYFPDPAKRAKLMAMPHGSQFNATALGQPEGMAMDQLSSFLAGYDASILYYFPRGYDHRFWKALADSNALIAANEDIVMTGKERKGVSVIPQTPFSAPTAFRTVETAAGVLPKYLPDVRKSDLLQVAAFEKDGRILVAAGNFWEKGDVVFQLRVPGLKPDQEYTVQEKAFHRQFVPEQGKFFTGKMLADGILLHAGAMRWAFFEIAPATKIPAATVTSAEMRRELERCQKENRCAAEEEAARDKALHAENDIGELKSMSSGALSCKPVTKNGKPMLEVVSGKNTLLLNPCGMALESWTVDGTEQCSANFGQSAFWTPGKNGMVVNNNYRVTDQKISTDGLHVTAEFTTTVRSYPWLPGLKIIKTITVSPDLKKLAFHVNLNNTQTSAMNDVGYRWCFIPAAWSKEGRGIVKNAGMDMARPEKHLLFAGKNCTAWAEQVIGRLFGVPKAIRNLQGNEFQFTVSGGRTVSARFLPGNQFAGAAVWHTPQASTFEPFYLPVFIAPGESVSFSAEFRME